MKQHILYGIRNADVYEAADALSIRLGCTFQKRDSDYLGIYLLANIGSAEVRVISQPGPDGDPLEDDFVDYGTLVYIEVQSDFPELEGLHVATESLTKLRVEQ